MDLLLILTAGSLLFSWLFSRVTSLPLDTDERLSRYVTSTPLENSPLVSVLIPVRNEEESIEQCLRSVLAQDYPSFEVVVVDDNSTDATPSILERIAKEFGSEHLTIVRGCERPSGWTGKNFAMHVGAQRLRGTWVLQIDGDVVLREDAISAAMAYATRYDVKLLSLLSSLELLTWVEKVFQGAVPILAVGYCRVRDANNPSKDKMFINGQFILYEQQVFDSLGGYEAIKAEVTDDIAIGRLFQVNNYQVRLLYGQEFVRTRMYKTFKEIWSGWSKFLFNGLFLTLPRALGFSAVVGIVMVGVPVCAIASAAAVLAYESYAAYATYALTLGVTFYLFFVWKEARAKVGLASNYAFSYPLGALAFCSILVASAYRIRYGKGISWKGRAYFNDRNEKPSRAKESALRHPS